MIYHKLQLKRKNKIKNSCIFRNILFVSHVLRNAKKLWIFCPVVSFYLQYWFCSGFSEIEDKVECYKLCFNHSVITVMSQMNIFEVKTVPYISSWNITAQVVARLATILLVLEEYKNVTTTGLCKVYTCYMENDQPPVTQRANQNCFSAISFKLMHWHLRATYLFIYLTGCLHYKTVIIKTLCLVYFLNTVFNS